MQSPEPPPRPTYSSLYPRLKEHLLSPNNPVSPSKEFFEIKISREPMVLALVQYRCYAFATDLHHTIQCVFPSKNLEPQELEFGVHPFNEIDTIYYRRLDQASYDFWEPYNTSDSSLLNEGEAYPHPYCPHFFLHSFLEQFRQYRQKAQSVLLPTAVLRVSSWRLRVCNVSGTGWYAPFL
jgi:hypothetical protein